MTVQMPASRTRPGGRRWVHDGTGIPVGGLMLKQSPLPSPEPASVMQRQWPHLASPTKKMTKRVWQGYSDPRGLPLCRVVSRLHPEGLSFGFQPDAGKHPQEQLQALQRHLRCCAQGPST